MKIAVPTRGTNVDDHFGHCEMYTIFTVDGNNTITNTETLPAPQGCGCKSNIASKLKDMGVKVMLAGNMGMGALNVLSNNGIDVYRGCTGDVQLLTEAFLKGSVNDSGKGCDHHNEAHQCNH